MNALRVHNVSCTRTGFWVFRPRSKTCKLRDSSAEGDWVYPRPWSTRVLVLPGLHSDAGSIQGRAVTRAKFIAARDKVIMPTLCHRRHKHSINGGQQDTDQLRKEGEGGGGEEGS